MAIREARGAMELVENVLCCCLVPLFLAQAGAAQQAVFLAVFAVSAHIFVVHARLLYLVLCSSLSLIVTYVLFQPFGYQLLETIWLAIVAPLVSMAAHTASSSCWSDGEVALLVQCVSVFCQSSASKLPALAVFGQLPSVVTIVQTSLSVLLVCVCVWWLMLRADWSTAGVRWQLLCVWLVILVVSTISACRIVTGANCPLWIVNYATGSSQKVWLLVLWGCLFGGGVAVCLARVITGPSPVATRHAITGRSYDTLMRKVFHALAGGVFVTGLRYEPLLLYAAAAALFYTLVIVELVRVSRCGWLSRLVDQCYRPLMSASDTRHAPLVLSNIYLLLGCAGILWYADTRHLASGPASVPLLSGVITVGVGDACAAVIGCWYGRHHWSRVLGTGGAAGGRTVEGTAAMFVSQIMIMLLLRVTGFMSNVDSWWQLAVAAASASCWEAVSGHCDNLTLPLVFTVVYQLVSSRTDTHAYTLA